MAYTTVSDAYGVAQMGEALKARQQNQPSSMAYQRWAGVLSAYTKHMPRATAWRSREQLLTEARTREAQVGTTSNIYYSMLFRIDLGVTA